ncbi:MAG TPA: ATP-binding protein [Gemmatimonadaceae bacterium]|nr:ATP-binding protein [Gemmatimonadaceae bacterium]
MRLSGLNQAASFPTLAAPGFSDVNRELLKLAACLAFSDKRSEAANKLAHKLGASSLIVFVRDPETNVLLAAPGFPQTLPNGRVWRAFLSECVNKKEHAGGLPLHSPEERLPSVGFASGPDTVAVLVGRQGASADTGWLVELLPLMGAAFRGEQLAVFASTEAKNARETAARATSLTAILQRTRLELENALLEARQARLQLELANASLSAHGDELESANQRLQSQKEELEVQAEEMETQQAELEMQTDELQRAISELTAAREESERANQAKSEFLATMSHELRTPLNAIAGYVQLIEMGVHGPVTEQQLEALGRIYRSQRHLLGLINDILNLSRIEAGRVEYHITNVPLNEAIKDLSAMIEPQVLARGLTFEVRGGENFPAVSADREKLQQILLNLLTNATKFSDSPGSITIDAETDPTSPGQVLIHVRDTGSGIPADKLEAIFEPFVQVDSSHSRSGQGIGLGLAISRDLARGMGGDLKAESQIGEGSTFTLRLKKAN